MKKNILFLNFVLLCLAGSAQMQTESRTVKPFSILDVNGAAKVEIISYDSLFCKVTADVKDQYNVMVVNKGDRLIITTTGMVTKEIKVLLGCKGLKSVVTDGASSVESSVVYKTDKFSVEANGASKSQLMAEAKLVDVRSDGSSNVRLQGKADSMTVFSDGSSKIKAVSMEAKKVTVQADGSSNIVVNAKESITAKADAASRVYYEGNPPTKNFDKTGSSTIKEYAKEDAKYVSSNSGSYTYGKKHTYSDPINWKHYMGVSLTTNGYLAPGFSTNLPAEDNYMELNYGRCLSLSVNVIEHDFHLKKNYLNLCTGLGFDFNRFNLRNKVTLNPDSSYVTATVQPDNNYKKNLLKVSYVTVPLYFEINTKEDPFEGIHIGAGVEAGLKLGSRTKQYYEHEGYRHYIYKRDDYNINPFRLQAMVQVGWNGFTLYGNYSLTPLFEKNKGPELYPFTIGVRAMFLDWD
jgi:hypothetical protein